MADELNTPNHRYYQPQNNILLAPNEVSKQFILASGIAKIDAKIINPLFALAEPGVWYDPSDLTTLFQDNAGTTPVTTPGQTVGLMLDKSQGLVLGSELVTNGDFSSATGWTASNATLAVVSGALQVTGGTGGNGYAYQALTTVANTWYKLTFSTTFGTEANGLCRVGTSIGGNELGVITWTVAGQKTIFFFATSTTSYLRFGQNTPTTGLTILFDNISVKLLAGNHATQATSTQRPTYGVNPIVGTRNLLTRTEEFDNAAWTKSLATVSANTAAAPDGTTTADKLVATATTGFHSTYPTFTTLASSYTYSVYAKAAEYTNVSINDGSGGVFAARFNLATGVVISTSGANLLSTSIQDAGNGWYRCSVTFTGVSGSSANTVIGYPAGATLNNFGASYTGDGTSGVLIWGAQLELGSTATAYQKVVSQYEVTEAGVQSAGYLAFDGVDDGMVTGTITPAIDKVQVFAGVRKLSDADVGTIVELSADVSSNNGAFVLFASFNGSIIAPSYLLQSRGTIRINTVIPSSYSAPITNVLTGLDDISGDTAALRVNALQVGQSTTDQGSGNYLAYPLYIGRRGGASLPFNGRIYSLITRFGANLTDGQIASTESWVNAKTGAY